MQKEWLQCKPTTKLRSQLSHVVLAMIINFVASMTDREFTLRSGYVRFARRAVQVLAEHFHGNKGTEPFSDDDMAKVYYYLGRIAWLLREDVIAAFLYTEALECTKWAFGNDHTWIVWIHKNLALIYGTNGLLSEAIPHIQRAIEHAKQTLQSEVEVLEQIETDFVATPIAPGKAGSFSSFRDSISAANVWDLLLRAMTRHTLELPPRHGGEPCSKTRPAVWQQTEECDICQTPQLQFTKDLHRLFIDSEIRSLNQELRAVDVHLQACMRLILGNLGGVCELYGRAAVTQYKRWGPASRDGDKHSAATINVGSRVFGKFFNRRATALFLRDPFGDSTEAGSDEEILELLYLSLPSGSIQSRSLIELTSALLGCQLARRRLDDPIGKHECDSEHSIFANTLY